MADEKEVSQMSDLGNKQIMAANIRRLMQAAGVTATDVCCTLKIPMPTFSDWINAKTYPRIDKIEMLAGYFKVSKADLVEEHSPAAPGERAITDADLMFALWGDTDEVSEADLADVRRYAQFIRERKQDQKK